MEKNKEVQRELGNLLIKEHGSLLAVTLAKKSKPSDSTNGPGVKGM